MLGQVFSLIFLVGLSSIAACQDLENDPRVKELRKKSKLRRQYYERIRDKIRVSSSHYYQLNFKLRSNKLPFSRRTLSSDPLRYELLADEKIQKEIEISEKTLKELEPSKLKAFWKKTHANYGKSGELKLIEDFESSLADFDSKYESILSRKQHRQLDALFLRRSRDFSLSRILFTCGKEVGVEQSQLKNTLSKAQTLARKLILDGNRLLVGEVDKIFPGYLEKIGDDELAQLPILPLSKLIALMEKPQSAKRYFDHIAKNPDVDLKKGQWLFTSPVFKRTAMGDWEVFVEIGTYSASEPKAPWSLMRDQLNLELSDKQQIPLEYLVRKSVRGVLPQMAKPDLGKIDLDTEIGIVTWIEESLLESQRRSLANYCRLHALFMFGPELLSKKLTKDKEEKVLEEQIGKMKGRLLKHVRESQNRMVDLIWNEFEQQLDPHFERIVIMPNNSASYEDWLTDLAGHQR